MKEFLETLDFEIDLAYEYTEDMTFDEFEEHIQEVIREQEIIYYSKAIKLLAENDPSLRESLSLASEHCYEVSNLNSEVLATLLYQDMLMQDWHEMRDEIEEKFNEVLTEE